MGSARAAQRIIVTGASDGVGAEAARQLAERGEQVVLVGRSADKTAALARQLNVPCHVCDYADLAQVSRLADELLAAYPRIDVLANNAGGLFKKETTADGFDKTFQVNYLAGFLLTHRLLDRLLDSQAKVIQTSSVAARWLARFDLDDFTRKTPKSPWTAYGDTKLAYQLFTRELHRRYGGSGLAAVSFHPGFIASGFGAGSSSIIGVLLKTPLKNLVDSPSDGGARLAWLALGTPGETWQPGMYYEDNRLPAAWKVNAKANDGDLARELWVRSEKLLGLTAGDTRRQDKALAAG